MAADYSWIYLATALLALLIALLDGTIQTWIVKGNLTRAQAHSNAAIIRHLTRELKQAEKDFKDGILNVAQYKAEVARIKAEMAAITP